jgi:hypothetical protein
LKDSDVPLSAAAAAASWWSEGNNIFIPYPCLFGVSFICQREGCADEVILLQLEKTGRWTLSVGRARGQKERYITKTISLVDHGYFHSDLKLLQWRFALFRGLTASRCPPAAEVLNVQGGRETAV